MLEREVRFGNEVDYQNWTADKTPDSLLVLGKWFSQNVATMERPEEEKKAKAEELARLSDKLRPMYEVPDWVLTERTFSLITDIGMYLGETFQANYSVINRTFAYSRDCHPERSEGSVQKLLVLNRCFTPQSLRSA